MEWRADRMTVLLFDPASPPPGAWPESDSDARRYIAGVAATGVAAMVANVRTEWRALRLGDRVLPVTVNHGEIADSYVCLPHSAYSLYARQELDIVDVGGWRPLFAGLVALADRLLRAARVNHVVHLDNWLLSTNLHGDWRGEGLAEARHLLVSQFPQHVVALRSLDPFSCPELLAAARADRWVLLPSRQIWVTPDMAEWRARHSTANDRRLLRRSGMAIETLTTLQPGDAERIAELYRKLYVGKYSPLNPVFTPAWITMTHGNGLIAYRGARGADGKLLAVAGSLVRGNVLTPPVVGYDTARPQAEGLYRIASLMFCEQAEAGWLRLNGSAGAGHFKRARGAVSVIEYSAWYVAHLTPARRSAIHFLAMVLNRLAVPMMRRRGL
jgi:hypothetical protein